MKYYYLSKEQRRKQDLFQKINNEEIGAYIDDIKKQYQEETQKYNQIKSQLNDSDIRNVKYIEHNYDDYLKIWCKELGEFGEQNKFFDNRIKKYRIEREKIEIEMKTHITPINVEINRMEYVVKYVCDVMVDSEIKKDKNEHLYIENILKYKLYINNQDLSEIYKTINDNAKYITKTQIIMASIQFKKEFSMSSDEENSLTQTKYFPKEKYEKRKQQEINNKHSELSKLY